MEAGKEACHPALDRVGELEAAVVTGLETLPVFGGEAQQEVIPANVILVAEEPTGLWVEERGAELVTSL